MPWVKTGSPGSKLGALLDSATPEFLSCFCYLNFDLSFFQMETSFVTHGTSQSEWSEVSYR